VIITVGTLSGGVGSWAACRRWIDANGTDGLALLFADTGEEDPDTYRFLDDAAADLGAPLYRVTSGRDIWEVFRAHRWIGNSKLAHCSWDLKTEPSRAWIADHPGITGIIVGIDWSEQHRLADITARWGADGLTVLAPLVEDVWGKRRAQDLAERRGLRLPAMYGMGFGHANCRGCVKAGQGHWLRVLEQWPDVYARHEAQETALRAELGQGAILRDWSEPGAPALTLTQLRQRAESHAPQLDLFEEGGCGCFT
jgi:3'-phosphoadenosine 5'-phosphosulfate sulfotransferase (PAPS reductase)/FAD synthetase